MPRRDFTPSSSISIAYFAFAHLSLASALIVLAVRPELPGGFFYHPKMIALVHLVTLGWLSGSILGAFYIVAPLVLRLPMPVRWPDWAAFAAFGLGTGHLHRRHCIPRVKPAHLSMCLSCRRLTGPPEYKQPATKSFYLGTLR